MSGEEADDDPPRHVAVASAREEALAALRRVREQCEYKAFGNGRIREPEHERVRVKYLKTLVSACNSERRLLQDRELDALAEEVEELRQRLDGEEPTGDLALADGGSP